MYLSKLELNPKSKTVSYEIRSPYQMHRTLMRAFPNDLSRKSERMLFRLEKGRNPYILVQSTMKPDWISLENEKSDYLLNYACKDISNLKFSVSKFYRFRLRANPVQRDPESHKRFGVYLYADCFAWMQRKGEQGGFVVQGCEDEMQSSLVMKNTGDLKRFNKSKDGKVSKISLNMIDFEGFLQISNEVLFRQAFSQGIGPAKGFGCGLLSLARI